MFSLFRRSNQSASAATSTPASNPNVIDISESNDSKSNLAQANVPVIAVRDHEDDGFSHVQVRPLTYAEVASMNLDHDSSSHRVVIPCESMYPESEEESLESSVESVLYNSTYQPRYGIHVTSEFEYGDRIRGLNYLAQDNMAKPIAYAFKPTSDKLINHHIFKVAI